MGTSMVCFFRMYTGKPIVKKENTYSRYKASRSDVWVAEIISQIGHHDSITTRRMQEKKKQLLEKSIS